MSKKKKLKTNKGQLSEFYLDLDEKSKTKYYTEKSNYLVSGFAPQLKTGAMFRFSEEFKSFKTAKKFFNNFKKENPYSDIMFTKKIAAFSLNV